MISLSSFYSSARNFTPDTFFYLCALHNPSVSLTISNTFNLILIVAKMIFPRGIKIISFIVVSIYVDLRYSSAKIITLALLKGSLRVLMLI